MATQIIKKIKKLSAPHLLGWLIIIFKAKIPEEFKKNVYFVELQLHDSKNELISENFYWLAENDDFTSLSALPDVELDITIKKKEIDKYILCELLLTNPSADLAFFTNPSIRRGNKGGEVLPSYWSDNYFCILPRKTKELTVEFRKSDLGGEKPYLKLDGWNIVPQLIRIN